MGFQMPLTAMKQFLERTDRGQKREDRFNHSALIPAALRTEFEVRGDAIFAAKTEIAQGDGLLLVPCDEGQKTVVTSIGSGPLPIHHTPVLIDDPAHFHAHDPAPITLAFLPDLLRRAAFADRMNEFNAIAVRDGKESGRAQEAIRPVAMCGEQALQAGAAGQARKQVRELAVEPAVKVAKASAFEREHRPDRDEFAGVEFTLRMFGHKLHAIINGAKEMCNNVFSLHESLQENGFGHYIFPAEDS